MAWRAFPSPAYDERNEAGETIVCLHDLASGGREYRPLIRRIPHGARLIVIDWAGHGKSGTEESVTISSGISVENCANLLGLILNKLGILCPILLGSGFGGAVAIHFAAANPERIAGLVLCHPAGLLNAAQSARGDATKSKPVAMIQTLAQCRRKFAPTAPRSDDPFSAQEARRQALRTAVLQVRRAEMLMNSEMLLSKSHSALLGSLSEISCAAMFAVSRESGQYPAKEYVRLLDRLTPFRGASTRRLSLTEFVGGFHPAWDESIRFAQAVNGFTQSLRTLERHKHAWLLCEVDWPTRETNLWRCVHPQCGKETIESGGTNPNDRVMLQP